MLKKEIKNGLSTLGFYVGVSFILYLLFKQLNAVKLFTSKNPSDYLYYVATMMAFSGFTPFACVYPALANAISFCDEYNNGYLPFILHRSGIKHYYFSKIGGVGIIGGLTIFIPMFLAFLAIVMFSAPLTDLTNFSAEGFYFETMWEEYLLMGKGLLIMGMKLVLGFVFGFLWALVPLAISAWIPNRYVALIAPFVLYQSLWSLLTDSFFNPLYLLRCDFHGLGLSYPGALLIQFSYITIAALAFYFGLKRRIPDV